MKQVSILLVMLLVLGMCAVPVYAEGEYSQSPYLDDLVASGELPPVEERLPENPTVWQS